MTSPNEEHEHCWHGSLLSTTTLMTMANHHTRFVQCCHCGEQAIEHSHEEERPIKGHGPHVYTMISVVDSIKPLDPGPSLYGIVVGESLPAHTIEITFDAPKP